ncbi:MAG: hypothetical protein ACI4HQ_04430 [Acetatifactor sp.]
MESYHKQKVMFFVLLILCILLTACGSAKDKGAQNSWTCTSDKVSGWEEYSFRPGTFLAVKDKAYYLGEGKDSVVLAEVSAQDREVHMLFQSKGLINFCPGKDGTEIACYVRDDEEAVILLLDLTGKELQRFTVDREISGDRLPGCMCLDMDGNLALTYGNKLVLLNPEGALSREIAIEDGTVRGIRSEERGHFLLQVAGTESGNGWIEDVSVESGVLTRLEKWDSTSGSLSEYPLPWTDLGLSEMEVVGVGESLGTYYVWTNHWTSKAKSPLYVNIVSKTDNVDEGQTVQKRITVVTMGTDQHLDAIAIAFNRERKDIQVKVEHLPIQDEAWNTRLASKENIDLVLLGSEFGVLQKAGYLQAIDPYLDKLGQNREEIIPAFLSYWQADSKIYGIPCNVILKVPYLRVNDSIPKEYSTENILTLIGNHPEIKSENGLFSLELLRLLLTGDLNAYLVKDGDKTTLNAMKFKKLCLEISSLDLDKQAYYDEFDELLQSSEPIYGELFLSNPKEIVAFLDKVGDTVSLIGYPTEEGRYTTIASGRALCLMRQCRNVEDSLDFMKYYYDNYDDYYPMESWGISYGEIQKQLEEACGEEKSTDETQITLTEEQVQTIWRVIEGAGSGNPYFDEIYNYALFSGNQGF